MCSPGHEETIKVSKEYSAVISWNDETAEGVVEGERWCRMRAWGKGRAGDPDLAYHGTLQSQNVYYKENSIWLPGEPLSQLTPLTLHKHS